MLAENVGEEVFTFFTITPAVELKLPSLVVSLF